MLLRGLRGTTPLRWRPNEFQTHAASEAPQPSHVVSTYVRPAYLLMPLLDVDESKVELDEPVVPLVLGAHCCEPFLSFSQAAIV